MLKGLWPVAGYFIATATQAAIAFFSVPLLFRALGTEQFGRWSLIEPVVQLLAQVGILGLQHGIIKQISKDGFPIFLVVVRQWISSEFFLVLTAILTAAVAWRMQFTLAAALSLGVLVYLEARLVIVLTALRGGNIVTGFASATIAKSACIFVLLLGATYLGVPSIHRAEDVVSWWCASAALALVTSGAFAAMTFKSASLAAGPEKPSAAFLYKDAIRYGFPMLMTVLLTMVILYADRFLIKAFLDYRMLGEYSIFQKLAGAMNFLILPVHLWWPTARFAHVKDNDGGAAFFRRRALELLGVFLFAGAALWLSSPWILHWFAPSIAFNPEVMLLLIFGLVCTGMAALLNVGLLQEGKTHWNILVAGIVAICHIGLCLMLIPRYGLIGAAAAVAASGFVNLLVQHLLSQRFYPLPFAYRSMMLISGGAIAVLIGINMWIFR